MPAVKEVSFDVTKEDADKIESIINHAWACDVIHHAKGEKLQLLMSLTACHASGCPLDLNRMLEWAEKAADGDEDAKFNIAHDLYGIHRHINKQTGALEHCFLPRFAQKG